MSTKRELLGQGYRGKGENEKLRGTQGCDNHCYFFPNVIKRLRGHQL